MKTNETIKNLKKQYNLSFETDSKNIVIALDLSALNLNKIPDDVFLLSKLKQLNLSGNKLIEIPLNIEELTDLEYLNLFNNNFSVFPTEVLKLKKLKILHLGTNQITRIPKEISVLQNLQTLGLSGNPLGRFPNEVLSLRNLHHLKTGSNEISKLPQEIYQLKKLNTLYLTGNNINSLPKELSKLPNLNRLHVNGNPIKNIPDTIISKGTKSVLSYLQNEKIKLWTSKMVIVGQGGTGKSCMLDSLQGEKFDPTKETTHGMRIEELELPHPTEKDIVMKLKVWDFGGQEIYHATHQFYLTNNSLFVLVWNSRQGYRSGKLYYWLETIKALAPDSPIIIVATHSDDRASDMPRQDIKYKFSNVQLFDIDNKTGFGISELHKGIVQTASKLENMGIERPESWIRVSEKIKNLEQKYISRQKLYELFFSAGIESTNCENPAEYLHEMGDILYYPNEPKLKDTIITKPQWVSEHIAKLLDSKELDETAGFLERKTMKKLWSELSGEMQEKFILLMEKYDLAYFVDDPETVCLVVEKLKHEEADFVTRWKNFKNNREISIIYDNLNAFPAGIPTWFIARTHRFTTFTHWRLGALLQYDQNLTYDKKNYNDNKSQTLALIIAKPETRQILLKVRGRTPEYFSSILRDTLEFTLSRFEGLKMTLKVPCPGHNGEKCPHKFKLEHLEKYMQHTPPKNSIECPEGMESVSIPKMLYGVSFAPSSFSISDKIIDEMQKGFEKQAKLIKNESKEVIEQLSDRFIEIKKFMQLEFLKSYQVQQQMYDITCPNLFTLKSKENKSFFEKLRFDVYILELQLWCQYPGHQHPVGKPYEIKVARDWLQKIAPYYNRMMKFIQWTLPLVNPALSNIAGSTEIARDKIDLAKGIIRTIGDIEPNTIPAEANPKLQYADERDELFAISEILKKYDKTKHWGGLKRVITPEGYVLWLCPEHAQEYDIHIRLNTLS